MLSLYLFSMDVNISGLIVTIPISQVVYNGKCVFILRYIQLISCVHLPPPPKKFLRLTLHCSLNWNVYLSFARSK